MPRKKAAYAHVLIEHDGARYEVGSELPSDLPGLDELLEQGAAGHDRPVVEVSAGDGAESKEQRA